MKRVILIVLDSLGFGEAPDAQDYGDEGSNTIEAISKSPMFSAENLRELGFFNIDGIDVPPVALEPKGSFAKLRELSLGKDTTNGHWEIAGVITKEALPTYPDGFPPKIIEEFERKTGKRVLCNKPYSGTVVIDEYGKEHMETGALIVYTSADSVFQIAAHEDIVPVEKLYEYCEIARGILKGKHGVGRVIARPFIGEPGDFSRTERRHDFSLEPTGVTMLDILKEEGFDVLSVGKIIDIFAGRGITDFVRTKNNAQGISRTIEWMDRDFNGLLFTNLVDTDMIYGHRNDVDGYAQAISYFDKKLPEILEKMREEDILIITADHGCDPSTPSTDHSREYVPLLMVGKNVKSGKNFGTLDGFDTIAATVLSYIGTNKNVNDKALI